MGKRGREREGERGNEWRNERREGKGREKEEMSGEMNGEMGEGKEEESRRAIGCTCMYVCTRVHYERISRN